MAIAKIGKLEIIALQEDKEKILSLLQKLGIIELIGPSLDVSPQVADSGINLLELEEAVSFLSTFRKEKSGFLGGMITLKPLVYQQDLNEVIAHFDYKKLLTQLSALRNHLKNLYQHQEKLNQEKHLLFPWRKLRIPLDEICYTKNCGIILGILSRRDYPDLSDKLKEENIDFFCEVVHQDRANMYLVLFWHKEEFERLEAILKSHHFNFVTLSRHRGTAQDRLLEINRESLVLADQIEDAKNKITELAQEQFKLMFVYDHLNNIQRRQGAEKNLLRQQFTFSLSGWIKQRNIKLVERELVNKVKDVAVFVSEPQADENVPVILENKRLIQPFEFITGIYGMPKYHELDPTPYLAPFFFFYFGFCVSDVGYGFILALLSLLVLKKFKMGPQGQKFFRLFFYCGISTIIVGAATEAGSEI